MLELKIYLNNIFVPKRHVGRIRLNTRRQYVVIDNLRYAEKYNLVEVMINTARF